MTVTKRKTSPAASVQPNSTVEENPFFIIQSWDVDYEEPVRVVARGFFANDRQRAPHIVEVPYHQFKIVKPIPEFGRSWVIRIDHNIMQIFSLQKI